MFQGEYTDHCNTSCGISPKFLSAIPIKNLWSSIHLKGGDCTCKNTSLEAKGIVVQILTDKEGRINTYITCLGRHCMYFTAELYFKQVPGKYQFSFLSSSTSLSLNPHSRLLIWSLRTNAHFIQKSPCNVTHRTLNSIFTSCLHFRLVRSYLCSPN